MNFIDMLFEPPLHPKGHKVAKPTSVYRVEMSNGNGPFNPDHEPGHERAKNQWYDQVAACYSAQELQRLAANERIGWTERDFAAAHGDAAYGCESLDALRRWFPPKVRAFLAKHGATAVEYEIPTGGHLARVEHGEIIFARPECRRVRTLDLKELDHA